MAQDLLRQLSGNLRRMFSMFRLRTSQENFPFTVRPGEYEAFIVK
jgi:hypothetical protein